jgi:hypothetical protein
MTRPRLSAGKQPLTELATAGQGSTIGFTEMF